MKQALAMLEEIADEVFSPYDNKLGDAILALRAAIAQAQEPVAWYFVRDLEKGISFAPDSDSTKSWQPLYTAPLMATEPVAWMHPSWIDPDTRGWASDSFNAIPIEGWVPVFTAPRQWQGLTEQEIKDCEKQAMVNGSLPFEQRSFFARAIEAKLKEKNT